MLFVPCLACKCYESALLFCYGCILLFVQDYLVSMDVQLEWNMFFQSILVRSLICLSFFLR